MAIAHFQANYAYSQTITLRGIIPHVPRHPRSHVPGPGDGSDKLKPVFRENGMRGV